MGYSYRIYDISKDFAKKIQACKTNQEFLDLVKAYSLGAIEHYVGEDEYCALYNLGEELHDFGKFYENADEMYKHGKDLFSSKDLQDRYYDYGAIILDPDGLKCAIEWTKQKVISVYKRLLLEKTDPDDVFADRRPQIERLKNHIKDELRWWSYDDCPCNTDREKPFYVNSWLYEHVYFDLVYLYKTFDFENRAMIFMGW